MVGESKERAAAEAKMWATAFKRLVCWAIRRHRLSLADAQEIVQEGIQQHLAVGGVADSADLKGLLRALGSRINGVAIDRRRKKALREDALIEDGSAAELVDLGSEQRVVTDDIARKAVSALLDRVEGDDLVLAVIMQIADDVEDPAAQAKALGRDVHEVYNARRRLKTHVEAIEKLMEAW